VLRVNESQVRKSALSIREKQLGEDHPDVAKAYNNIGLVLQTMGRMDEAKPYFTKAVDSYEASLGDSHPSLATSLNNLAGCAPCQRIFAP
jgi:tetratricopeptide (TPR) repeat protein